MSDRFVVQIGHPLQVPSGGLFPSEWAVIDTKNGLAVNARPVAQTESGWRELCHLLNDIYEEGKQSNGKT